MKRSWFGSREETEMQAERKLRYAVVTMLDVTDGDQDWVTDVVEMAQHDWRRVNE